MTRRTGPGITADARGRAPDGQRLTRGRWARLCGYLTTRAKHSTCATKSRRRPPRDAAKELTRTADLDARSPQRDAGVRLVWQYRPRRATQLDARRVELENRPTPNRALELAARAALMNATELSAPRRLLEERAPLWKRGSRDRPAPKSPPARPR
jgi:hypothetical protein